MSDGLLKRPTYLALLNRAIDDGIAAATEDYGRGRSPNSPEQLRGAIAGFNACREKWPADLIVLHAEAQRRTHDARCDGAADAWYHICFEAEVHWVLNVLSAALRTSLRPDLPTGRGMMKAAELVGVADA